MALYAGAFIAFVKVLQGLLQPTSNVPGPPADNSDFIPSQASLFVGCSPLARMRWKHPFFKDLQGSFPKLSELLTGKYAWKVCGKLAC